MSDCYFAPGNDHPSALCTTCDKLADALKDLQECVTVTYESEAKAQLKPEYVGKKRVWASVGCWLYPGDCIYEADKVTIEKAKEALSTYREMRDKI